MAETLEDQPPRPADEGLTFTRKRQAALIISGLILLAAFGIGGKWLVGRVFASAGVSSSTAATMIADTGGWGGRRMGGGPVVPNNSNGIRRIGDAAFLVRSDGALASITRDSSGWQYRFGYNRGDLLDNDTRRTLNALAALAPGNPPVAAKLTPEQTRQLRALGADPGMVTDAPGRQSFADAWSAYTVAGSVANSPTEAKLLEALKTLGQSSLEPTRAALRERAEATKKIVTAEQIRAGLGRRG